MLFGTLSPFISFVLWFIVFRWSSWAVGKIESVVITLKVRRMLKEDADPRLYGELRW